MRHRKPTRYRGNHRHPVIAPRTRYGIVVSTALVGAGVIAFGAGTALPQPPSGAVNAALEVPGASGGEGGRQASEPSPTSEDAPDINHASRAERRAPAPAPEKLPEWVRPADGVVSSGYGYRPDFHGGTDFAVPHGSPIRAASAGVVEMAEWYGGYGQAVIIDHGNGVVTYYAHNSELLVNAGQHVQAGDVIAKSGSTGQSTGPHLHFEVRINDERIDPAPYLRARGVQI